MKSSTVPNRKTGRMIAKNLIILLVLIVVAVLSILAWFTQGSTATANGINVQAKASGIEVSWEENGPFYDNLTALDPKDVVADETGLAKSLLTDEGEPASLKLVTGNGLNFFEPLLNRRTGTVLKNGAVWQGADILPENSEGKYIDIPLYFRSDIAREIYLAGDSEVSPKSTTDRMSDYGDFSKDYICAASRVAFLNSDSSKCSYIWAPNSNYELAEDANGYTKVTEIQEEEVSGGSTGGDLGSVINYTSQNGDYYLWLPNNYNSDPNTQASVLTAHKMNFTVYDEANNKGLYTYTYTIQEPNTGTDPTIIYYVNQSGTSWNSDNISNVDISKSKANNDSNDTSPKVALADTFNLNNTSTQQDRKAPAFYITGFKAQSIDITIGYNPADKEIVIIGYSSEGTDTKTYNRAGTATTTTIQYYEIDNNAGVVLANVDSAVAVSSNSDGKKSIRFKNSNKLNILPASVTKSEFFTAKKTGEGADATYQFQNVSTNKYLTVSNGEISLTTSGSDFALVCIEGFEGPALKCGDYYLVYNGRKFAAYTIESFDTNDLATIFTGSSYKLLTSSASETYKYYDSAKNQEVTLSSTSTPPLFATATGGSATTKVGDTPILTLTKASDDAEYYTGKIVMRVWAEGTDRDALTPLADGIFDLSLHFTSK